ncbi:prepilin-type N-terminal cleavage/methylation domain-containing protein [Elusimicrobium posterum]|uniref:type IV pilin protein n=1 Tax=Elusimicrobium posterum TaxID=3116653 RepID=UPI003C730354
MKKTKKGFTLIELMVVVIIIGILTAIAVPQYLKSVEKGRAAEAITYVNAFSKALNAYYAENDTCDVELRLLPVDVAFNTTSGAALVSDRFRYYNLSSAANPFVCGIIAEKVVNVTGKSYSIVTYTRDSNVHADYRGGTFCRAAKTNADGYETCMQLTARTASEAETQPCPNASAFSCFRF